MDIVSLLNGWLEEHDLKAHFGVIPDGDRLVCLTSPCGPYGTTYMSSYGILDVDNGKFQFMQFLTPEEVRLEPLNIGASDFFKKFKNHLGKIHGRLRCPASFGE